MSTSTSTTTTTSASISGSPPASDSGDSTPRLSTRNVVSAIGQLRNTQAEADLLQFKAALETEKREKRRHRRGGESIASIASVASVASVTSVVSVISVRSGSRNRRKDGEGRGRERERELPSRKMMRLCCHDMKRSETRPCAPEPVPC
ncbi:uncharacterized protein COLE_05715 [Cutaneotrichosporon oleaginosum]|nr:hypothetical protein COLE_05715 [Cutaneotrichosporon oleaginosum]